MRRAYINATVITGNSSDEAIKNGCVIVDEFGKIAYVGEQNDTLLEDIEIIDLSGKYVMPGLINTHIHMFNTGGPVTRMDPRKTAKFMKMLRTPIGKMLMKKMYGLGARSFINAGVTTIRDVGSYMEYDLILRDLIEAGEVVGPRIVTSGGLITPTGGHGSDMPGSLVCDGANEFARAARHNFHIRTDWVKVCNTGGVADGKEVGEAGMLLMTDEELEALCTEAHKRKIPVAVHCESEEGLAQAIRAGVDSVEHGAGFDEEMAKLINNNPKTLYGYTFFVPTISAPQGLIDNIPNFEDNEGNKVVLENARIIKQRCIDALQCSLKYGVRVSVGTDASVPMVTPYNTYKELVFFKEYSDLSNAEIIEIATKGNAELLRLQKVTGMVKVGLDADFMVLEKDPLADLNNIKKPVHVVVRGYFIEEPSYKVIEGVD